MIKRVVLTVMDQTNKKVLKRFKVLPDRVFSKAKGKEVRTYFTAAGIDKVLDALIEQIDAANPGHCWRLVSLGKAQFKLVWDEQIRVERERDEFAAKILST